MTCQWCKHYRRRGGIALCLSVDSYGRIVPEKLNKLADGCPRFDPRVSCTTCRYRCSQDDRDANMGVSGSCPKWELKELSTWGGSRRYRNSHKNKKQEV